MGEVSLRNVWKRYGSVDAVRGLNRAGPAPECVANLGPSGAGKTSTLKMIAGLEDISDGQIFIDGRLANFLEPHERSVAMTFESYALYPHMSVFDNMALPLRSPVHKKDEPYIRERVTTIATMLGIDPLLDRRPAQLSQGQKQRVGLGRCLVREPSVFLFDAPLSHVDAKVRHRMRMEIKRIQTQLRTTSIYVTHDYLEAMALGDRLCVLNQGQIQQMGTAREIFDTPADLFVAGIVGDPRPNFLDATLTSSNGDLLFQLQGADCTLPAPPNLAAKLQERKNALVKIVVRPMYISASLPDKPQCQIKGQVYTFERIETKGVLTVKVGDIMVLPETAPDFRSRPDQDVWLQVDLGGIRVFDPVTTRAIA